MNSRRRVVVIGDLLNDLDLISSGPTRIGDAGFPILSALSLMQRAGGAGLVAAQLGNLGWDVSLWCQRGAGASLQELLTRSAVEIRGISRATIPTKARFIDDRGSALLRVDDPIVPSIPTRNDSATLIEIRSAAAVVVTDYAAGVITEFISQVVNSAMAAGVPVIWDPHASGLSALPRVTLLVPNRREAEMLAPEQARGSSDLARSILDRYQPEAVALTEGQGGACFYDGSGDPQRIRPALSSPNDSCGAGDAFVAHIVDSLLRGSSLRGAVRAGVLASGAWVSSRRILAYSCLRNDLEFGALLGESGRAKCV